MYVCAVTTLSKTISRLIRLLPNILFIDSIFFFIVVALHQASSLSLRMNRWVAPLAVAVLSLSISSLDSCSDHIAMGICGVYLPYDVNAHLTYTHEIDIGTNKKRAYTILARFEELTIILITIISDSVEEHTWKVSLIPSKSTDLDIQIEEKGLISARRGSNRNFLIADRAMIDTDLKTTSYANP